MYFGLIILLQIIFWVNKAHNPAGPRTAKSGIVALVALRAFFVKISNASLS